MRHGDDFQKKSTLYVTLTFTSEDEVVIKYAKIDQNEAYTKTITIDTGKACTLRWEVSWFVPPNATELVDDTIVIVVPEVPETTEAPADESENESSDSAEDPSGETETPSETPSEETETDHTGETTDPTGTGTDPTKETTADTESSEGTTGSAESESEPAETEAVTEPDTDAGGNET